MQISPLSRSSLLLHPIIRLAEGSEEKMAAATGFVLQHKSRHYLITNWHIVSGRRNDNGQPMAAHGGTPSAIHIWHNHMGGAEYLAWAGTTEELYDQNGAPRWLEHRQFGRDVDVVALPLAITTGISFRSRNLDEESSSGRVLAADVPDQVNIIGFPYGEVAAGRIAIWVQGSIATDMDIDYAGLPCFLVDSRTRRGQSGSPVIVYRGAADPARLTDGRVLMGHTDMSRLLGVYSGRINPESDLGKVWKTSAIREIMEDGILGNANLSP